MDLPRPILCLVTDASVLGARPLVEAVDKAVAGGVNLVQLRDRSLPARELLALACELRIVTQGRALLFVNDRIDVALASEADGVQLPEAGLPVAEARRIAGDRLLIGRSVHSLQTAIEAAEQGADLVQVGTVFPSQTHPELEASGVGLVTVLASCVSAPVVGIGGITGGNAREVIEGGASGVAVVRAILASEEPEAASATLKRVIEAEWRKRNE
ncbi:MAG: thiamine-phosphate pyrophosphorylase [Chloroflexi bacterium]|jgi:thiamine-phosphate pyrophosphorylase|nr:MAG: thiamine-phosphate pyrophosphorylase [Chloroflexota bacterium]